MAGELLTVSEVASLVRLCKKQVYASVKEGAIPHVRMGGAIRIWRKDVEEFLSRNYNPARQSAAA